MKIKKKKQNQNYSQRIKLSFMFSVIFFALTTVTMAIVGLLSRWIYVSKLFHPNEMPPHTRAILFIVLSITIGTALAIIFSRWFLKPIDEILAATDKVADGDYSVRVTPDGLNRFRLLGIKFNHMAEELDSVETLRTDFVNNFSHEFKTPIVSLHGFASMMKKEGLTEEEKNEYLNIIISESDRLAELSTNVLYLSKIEQQSILTDITHYNVTEQLRSVIILLESKWSAKNIDIQFDCREIFIDGNVNMLRQVWINLIDNAIKFSPENSPLKIDITQNNNSTSVTVTDSGCGMDENTLKHLFDKFYQGDPSHTTKGNGLGLAIAKRIVELHNGKIRVKNTSSEGSSFEVKLPL